MSVLPVIQPEVAPKLRMYLREQIVTGSLGDAKISVCSVIGGAALTVEVKLPDRDTVVVVYSLTEHIEAIAQAVVDGKVEVPQDEVPS